MRLFLKRTVRHKVWPWLTMTFVVVAGALRVTAQDASLPAEAAITSAEGSGGIADMATLKPIKNLRMPLEYYADGRVKTYLTAEEAKVPPDLSTAGRIEARRVKMEIFAETGTNVETIITADDCVYDRQEGKATSQAAVRLERSDLTISGMGFEWTAKDQVVRVLSNVKVIMNKNLNLTRVPQ